MPECPFRLTSEAKFAPPLGTREGDVPYAVSSGEPEVTYVCPPWGHYAVWTQSYRLVMDRLMPWASDNGSQPWHGWAMQTAKTPCL